MFRDLVSAMRAERERRNTHTRGRGRPEIAVGEYQLSFLIEQGFQIQDIADMFGCYRRTIKNAQIPNVSPQLFFYMFYNRY